MMIPKGKNQHVLPDGNGWCVIDEVNQMLVLHFSSQEEAMAHANSTAKLHEGAVLVHINQCHTGPLSSVSLPQEQSLTVECHFHPNGEPRLCTDFEPFLELDEYYFES